MPKPTITLRSDGARHELLLDGEPLGGVVEASVVAGVNQLAEVHLVLRAVQIESTVDDPKVIVPEATVKALRKLGWYAPDDENAPEAVWERGYAAGSHDNRAADGAVACNPYWRASR